nr:hypothetical protein BN444_01028 [Xanthomonas translucens pv. translucens DSM 18974]
MARYSAAGGRSRVAACACAPARRCRRRQSDAQITSNSIASHSLSSAACIAARPLPLRAWAALLHLHAQAGNGRWMNAFLARSGKLNT